MVDMSNLCTPIELMKSRVSRTQLKEGKEYYKIHKGVKEFIGKFIRTYYMGSGDGTTVHAEFELDGKKICVNDDMWGSIGGEELVYFAEVSESIRA
jgi:hypothetical protein